VPDVDESGLVEDGALPPDDFHDHIDRIGEVAHHLLDVPHDLGARLASAAGDLLVPSSLLLEAATALIAGNVALQGPPGTGKSRLAAALCRAFNVNALRVTAHEDWSTYEVIGRQELRVDKNGAEQIVPVNGFFTEAAIRCAGDVVRHFDDPDAPQATWLFIDELNRAHADRAFGELFSVLGTDELVGITLPHLSDAHTVLLTPQRFRIIATLNSVDKQFVNSLSQALRRRFTFLTVDIPERRRVGEEWGSSAADASSGSREFSVAVDAARARVERTMPELEDPDELVQAVLPNLQVLFDVMETIRYAGVDDDVPYVPVGTAALIDTIELLLAHTAVVGTGAPELAAAADWAASVKLAPLFETDLEGSDKLAAFAATLPAPFAHRFRRELERVAAAGLGYV
jgi:5-methylcytosine-specific restriction protein B